MFEQNNQNAPRRSFWSSAQGVGTIILGGIAAVAVVMFGGTILSFLATTIGLIVSVAIISVVGIMLSDKRLRTAIRYMITSWTKKLGSVIVETNPIKILKGYVRDLKNKHKEINKGINDLTKQMAKFKVSIDRHEESVRHNYALASQAKKRGDNRTAGTKAGNAKSTEHLLEKYKAIYERMEFYKTILLKMKVYAETMIERVDTKVKLKKEEYNMTKTSHNTFKNVWAIIKGGTAEKALFDEAWDYVTEQTELRVMGMESMLHGMQDFMTSIDLENAANMEEGLKSLEEWEKKMDMSFDDLENDTLDYLDVAGNAERFQEIKNKDNSTSSPKTQKREKVKVGASSSNPQNAGQKYF